MKKKVWIFLILFLVILTPCLVIPYFITNDILDRKVEFFKTENPTDYGLPDTHLFVKTSDGQTISCYEIPVPNPKGVILCISGLHGPSCTAFYGHSKMFRDNGFASILLDMRAHGESDGERIYAGYKEYLDVDAVVEYAQKKYPDTPIVVMGLSLGAAVAINSIAHNPDIDALITLSAFSSWEYNFKNQMSRQIPAFVCRILNPFVDIVSWCKFGYKESQRKPENQIKLLGNRPALLMHSKEDSQVDFSNFERLKANAPAHIQTYEAEGDNHFITNDFAMPQNDSIYAETILKFLNNRVANPCHSQTDRENSPETTPL